eukprot:SAG31_NODE_10815_length_1093_cov_2.266600_1_plen_301_part_10
MVDAVTADVDLLPLAQASDGCFAEIDDFTALFFTRLPFQGSQTKAYVGGFVQQLWRFNIHGNVAADRHQTEATLLLPGSRATSKNPMWHATSARLFFLSDRGKERSMNVWSSDADGGQLMQHTFHEKFEVITLQTNKNSCILDGHRSSVRTVLKHRSGQLHLGATPWYISLAHRFGRFQLAMPQRRVQLHLRSSTLFWALLWILCALIAPLLTAWFNNTSVAPLSLSSIKLSLPSAQARVAAFPASAERISSASLSADGMRIAVTVRGQLFVVPSGGDGGRTFGIPKLSGRIRDAAFLSGS